MNQTSINLDNRCRASVERTSLILQGEDIEGKVVRTHHTQRSLIFRFADDIYADFIPENGKTSIAVYSASRVGYGDLGVNQKRVEAWLDELQKAVPPSKL